ncbi:18905_t:CDS:2, partial [Gigaspora rosea]
VSEQYCYIPQFFVREFVKNCTTLQHEEICKADNLKCLSQNRVQPIEVAIFLFDIFVCFGAPIILQTDNGREFTAEVIRELLTIWPNVHIIHGHPRQSQGLVECANNILQQKVSKWMEDTQRKDWSHAPVSLVFGQNPLCYFSLLKEANEQ